MPKTPVNTSIEITVFKNATIHSLTYRYNSFGGICYIHPQGNYLPSNTAPGDYRKDLRPNKVLFPYINEVHVPACLNMILYETLTSTD
jgi:hypothetical protein